MKRIHTYESFLNENAGDLTAELAKYKNTFEEYCKEKNEDPKIREKALEFLDAIMAKAESDPDTKILVSHWFKSEGTLALQELMRRTIGVEKFREIWNGNSPEQLRDFNAFTLLDTVSLHNKEKK